MRSAIPARPSASPRPLPGLRAVADATPGSEAQDTQVSAHTSTSTTLARSELESLLHTAQEALHRSYLFDAGSGLLHRELFLDRLGQAASGVARGGACFGVLLIDVALPAWAGGAAPALHSLLGRRLVEIGRRSDSFARLDTASYAGLLLGNHSIAGSVAMAQKIVEQLARPLPAEGQQCLPRVAAGVALCPQHGHEPLSMLLNAHAAVSQALAARQSVAVYASRPGATLSG